MLAKTLTRRLSVACWVAVWAGLAGAQAPDANPHGTEAAAPLRARTADNRPLRDAQEAIARIAGADPEATIERAEREYLLHLRSLAAGTFDPKTAAAKWVALVDEAIAIPHRSMNGGLGGAPPQPLGSLSTALDALPGPNSWPEIKRLIDARPASMDRTVLQLLMARLMGDDEKVLTLCAQIDAELAKTGQPQYQRVSSTVEIRFSALARLGRLRGSGIVGEWLTASAGRGGFEPYVGDIFPEEEARDAMLRVLTEAAKNSTLEYLFFSNLRTNALAQQVALAHPKELTKAPWNLVKDTPDTPFLLRLIDRYGSAPLFEAQINSGPAASVYFHWLLWNGKAELAAKLARTWVNGELQISDWSNPPKDLLRTLARVQQLAPHAVFRQMYMDAALALGRVQDGIAYERALVTATTGENRMLALGDLIELHMRIGDLKAVSEDYALVDKFGTKTEGYDPAYTLLDFGRLTENSGAIHRAIAREMRRDESFVNQDVADALEKEGRWADAEKLVVQAYHKDAENHAYADEQATTLLQIYYAANRPQEVLGMLRRYPSWASDDLASLDQSTMYSSSEQDDGDEPRSALFYAAWAFARTGQKELARASVSRLLFMHPGQSKAYELLNSIGVPSTLKVYEDLQRANPASPMPIIWKGDLLMRLGKVREAAACVQRALACNPTFGPSYRHELYTLRGAILAKQGDRAGVKRCSELVRAIGLQTQAQELKRLGLLSQAESSLKQALALCPTDAPIQGDLASLLDDEYRPAEAETHRLAALRNLPEALGECSDGSDAARMAMTGGTTPQREMNALDDLVRRNPKDCRAYFARGSALVWSGRSKEAIPDFQRAVALDPKQGFAWKSLASALDEGGSSPALAQAAALQAMRLTPVEVRYDPGPDIRSVSDLAPAYDIIRRRLQELPISPSGSLLPLRSLASAERTSIWASYNLQIPERDRVAGELARSSEIREIAQLFHPTRFPFE